MTNGSPTSNRIVDLLRYKADCGQRRLDFEPAANQMPSVASVRPFRPLSADAVKHRERMLGYLSALKGRPATRA